MTSSSRRSKTKPSDIDEEMVYTIDRFQKALDLYTESEPYRSRRGLRSGYLQDHLTSKYRLRNKDVPKSIFTDSLWTDAVELGDRGLPTPRTPQPPRDVVKKRKQSWEDDDEEYYERSGQDRKRVRRRRGGQQRSIRKKGDRLEVTLALKSPGARRFLQQVAKAEERRKQTGRCDIVSSSSDSEEPSIWSREGGSFSKRSSYSSQFTFPIQITAQLKEVQDFATKGSPQSKQESLKCTECRRKNKTCSPQTFNGFGPCKQCEGAKTKCTFEELVDSKGQRKDAIDTPTIIDLTADEEPEDAMMGSIQAIETPWAHPINFKHDPTPSSTCHFCADHRYGWQGVGKKTLEVIVYLGSTQYEEIGAGHRAKGFQATRMCLSCSFERLQISSCKHEETKPIEYGGDANGDEITDEMVQAEFDAGFEDRMARTLECSICFDQAAYSACCQPQTTNKWQEAVMSADEGSKGCGLFLCKSCDWAFKDVASLKHVTEVVVSEGRALRADAEFLLAGSILHRSMV